ncbi:MAG: TetR/AcrR family transcriptional regulator, partial [Ruminococcus bicirculans (ex Wegman et al. 2014)]
ISDIVNNAGVAKGTFYLYFKDKYDIRNKLVSHKSSQLFRNAIEALNASGKKLTFNERIIFIVDNIINQLNENKSLLTFIAKNLSWGVFKHALTSPIKDDDIDFRNIYDAMLADAPYNIVQPEVMIFMIVELVSSTCYSSILYNEPVDIGELKPYLYICINNIIDTHAGSVKSSEKTRLRDRKRVFFCVQKNGRKISVGLLLLLCLNSISCLCNDIVCAEAIFFKKINCRA